MLRVMVQRRILSARNAWLLLFLLLACAGSATAYDYPITIQRGNGLANLFAKLNSGQSVVIAYLGGSVTENTGWRNNVTAWFNSYYPGKITEVSAGWSGTGSLIGAMRAYRDVLTYNPDLVFVEFAVNDLPEDPALFVKRNTEGIVRQAWNLDAMTDICFIETIAYYIEQPYLSGYYPTTVQSHYDVADFYGCPSVNVGWALYEHVLAGTPWTDLAPDRVHPNAAGSQIYSDAVVSYLNGERTRGGSSEAHGTTNNLTDLPVTSSSIRDMVSVSPLPSGWSAHYNEFGVSSFVQSSTVNSTIAISFTGPSAAVKIIVSGDSGGIAYSIDGGAYSTTYPTVNGYTYLWAFPIAKTLTNASHTVTFKVVSGVARIINAEASVSSTNPSAMTTSTPTGTNLALLTTQWQTDSNYSSSYDGSKAKDGVVSGISKWTSTGSVATHWLAYDLGSSKTVNGYIVRHAGAGGEEAYYNTKYFKIQSSSSMNGPWTEECTVDNSAQASVTNRSYVTPKTLRYVRLYITNPGVDNYTRIPEFEVLGQAPSNSMVDAQPSGVNVATSATQWQTDSNYSSSYDGSKAKDGVISSTSKWTSTGSVATHWLSYDLGSTKTVDGFIVRHASTGGEQTYYNTQAFKIQSSSSLSGPWTDECTVDNTSQAGVTNRSYTTPKSLRYVRLYITDPGVDNCARIPEFEVYSPGSLAEDFASMPSWSSSYDATWGSAATWSVVSGGQSGNALQAVRGGAGSSSKVKVYSISPNTNCTISVYIKCPSSTASYWAESGLKLGGYTADDYDNNSGTWTTIKKFSDSGTNGNNNTWTQYSTTFNSGSNTQVSVGFKSGNSTGIAPTVLWDTLRIQ